MRSRFLTALFTPTLLLLGLALFATPDAYAQVTPDGEIPANEGVCDELRGGTPGLFGLCNGFCEAQDCEATLDEATGEVTFGDNCRKSAPLLLGVYNNLVQPGEPAMPCVTIVEVRCPCEGLTAGDYTWDSSFTVEYCANVGGGPPRGDYTYAYTDSTLGKLNAHPESCTVWDRSPGGTADYRIYPPDSAEDRACKQSINDLAIEDGQPCI
jgi:hypothetical protein